MSKYRRMKLIEESNGASGKDPEFGAIFMCNSYIRKECLRQELYGFPIRQADFVKQVKAGMLLFLFDFESRELHGVFQALSDGEINIDLNTFPAQVKLTEMWRCRPLGEDEFRDAIRENYFTGRKFNFGLSKAQVQRLLKLFSFKKVERSRLGKTAPAKPAREYESCLGNTSGDCGFGSRCKSETDGNVDREFLSRVTSARGLGRRLTENYGFGDESNIGIEYDPNSHRSKDLVGYDFRMNNKSFGTDALTNYSDYSIVNDRRASENMRHTSSGLLENEYREKDGNTQASLWSNYEACYNLEADPVLSTQRSVPLESPYETNTGRYDPYKPWIIRDTTIKSSRHDLGERNVDLMGSASFAANSNYVLREEIIPDGGYVRDTFPSETVQPYPDEHNGTRINKSSSRGMDYYIPMPTEHPEYHTNTGMTGVACSESELRSGHLGYSQFPSLLTSAEAAENMRNIERLSYSRHSISPSFAYPRDLSLKDRVKNEISAYQHGEEFRGRVSYLNDRVVQDSTIYPSSTYPSSTMEGVDLYLENRNTTSGKGFDMYLESKIQNKVKAYHRHEEFGDDAFDSRKTDLVNPAVLERKSRRNSVFSRLAKPSKERDTSPDIESVDEIMAFLNECPKHWKKQKIPNRSNPEEDFGRQKKKRIHATEVLDNDLMHPETTTPDELLDSEERMKKHSAQKRSFIDFKRRRKAQICGSPSQGCKDTTTAHSAPQVKKRKLMVRPKLIDDNSEKNNEIPNEIVLASKSASEVPVHDLHGCGDQ